MQIFDFIVQDDLFYEFSLGYEKYSKDASLINKLIH